MTPIKQRVRNQFKGLFQHSLELIGVFDLDGNFIDANKIAFKKLGYEPDELSEIHLKDLMEKNQFERIKNAKKKVLKNKARGKPSFYKLKKKNNAPLYIKANFVPVENSDKKIIAILVIGKDITRRKKLEDKLKNQIQSRDRELKTKELYFQNIFENANDLIAILDDNFTHEYINKHYTDVLGYTREELINKHPFEYVHPEDLKEAHRTTLKGINEGEAKTELRYIAKNGDSYWFELKGKFFKTLDGKEKSVIISRDVTDRKKAEKILRNSEQKYRNLFKKIPDGFAFHKMLYDDKKTPVDYIFLDLNSAFEDFIGLKKDKIIGKRVTEVLPGIENDPVNWIEKFGKVASNGTTKRFEDYSQPLKKQYSVIAYSPMKDYFLTIFRDITQKKEAENNLKKSEEKYRLLVENSPYAILLLNEEGIVVDCNPATFQITKYKREEITGKNIFELDIFSNQTSINEFYNKFPRSSEKSKEKLLEFQICRKDGKAIWVEITSITFQKDNQTFFQTILNDISEQKKREKLQKEFSNELEKKVKKRTEKLEKILSKQKLYMKEIEKASQFKSHLMATMSHELRTPLNVIIGFSDLLLAGDVGELEPIHKEYQQDILSSAEHLLNMINEILDISKIEAGIMNLQLKRFSLDKVLHQIISEFKPLINEKSLEICLLGVKEQYIYADPIKLKSILYNLISNAIKYTKKGKIEIEIKETKKKWIFKIYDTGIGIDEDEKAIIFKEFKRSEVEYVRNTSGTGLGLPLAKKLVNLHKGAIWFESKLGKGSVFSFTIPKEFNENWKNIENFLKNL